MAIVGLALASRLWGITFGLPNEAARPDERHLIGYTLAMGGNHLNPAFFNYPSLYLYLLLGSYGAYFALGRLTGHFGSMSDLVAEYALSPSNLYLIDRVLVALLGTATVYLIFAIGERRISRRTGLFAAFFLSVAYLHVRESHFGTVDVPLTFWVTLATLIILRADSVRTPKLFALAGFTVGLAISTKYNAIALLVPLGLMHLRGSANPTEPPPSMARMTAFLLSFAAVGLGFVVGTPYSLLDHRTFLANATFELVNKSRELPAIDLGRGWLYHLRFSLAHGLGIPLLVASLAGLATGLRQKPRVAILLAAFPLTWWVGVGMSHYVYLRYAVPMVPALCIFAAWALDAAAGRLELRFRGRPGVRILATGALALGLAAWPAWHTFQWDRLIRRTDTRVVAADWIEHHVPSGANIGLVGPEYIWPQLWNAVPQQARYLSSVEARQSRGRRLRAELRSAHLKEHEIPSYDTVTWNRGRWIDALAVHLSEVSAEPVPSTQTTSNDPSWPEWIVLADHPAWQPAPGVLPLLGPSYVLAASFDGLLNDSGRAAYDRQDAFYFPFVGFSDVLRPGPNLRIYRRTM